MLKCYKCGRDVEAKDMRVCPECGVIACSECTKGNICGNCICDLSYIQ